MSDYKQARMRDGSAYAGHTQYLGQGIKRSCGKCRGHASPTGFRLVKPWGLICPSCQEKK